MKNRAEKTVNSKNNIEKIIKDLGETAQHVSLIRLITDTREFMRSEGSSYSRVLDPNLDYSIKIYYNESHANQERRLEVYFSKPSTDKKGEKVLDYDFTNWKLRYYKDGEWKKFLRYALNDKTMKFDNEL
ncbi:MAG: hypothetical protein OH338_03145 [Candidatus Parvarchaeota archaeon]|jgi:hypothetical protein|nr:hypothetical protein [Candidatus Parvarchaeota archaeon]MCW1294269.1 hypothetical protein [Candidatus Parvarchaeum tengchongense]MCL5976232.1 hypothetical protein [Candidatus Parvarchaeota archaeon]MCW1295773.1 hypothetical protein [Candidatus Parvarchaeum tengchongense]MCW1298855.1 hypothetical protein [Candidatus Parvarchaeum tengchongense]